MADYFFDSSALAKRYVSEPGSGWVRRTVAPTAGHDVYIVRITGVEIVAALALRARVGTLSIEQATAAMTLFKADFIDGFALIDVTDALVALAMLLAERHILRGYDAVQLAAALHTRESLLHNGRSLDALVSADGRLNTAAAAEGLTVIDPSASR